MLLGELDAVQELLCDELSGKSTSVGVPDGVGSGLGVFDDVLLGVHVGVLERLGVIVVVGVTLGVLDAVGVPDLVDAADRVGDVVKVGEIVLDGVDSSVQADELFEPGGLVFPLGHEAHEAAVLPLLAL